MLQSGMPVGMDDEITPIRWSEVSMLYVQLGCIYVVY